MAALGVLYPGCQVSYFDPRSCQVTAKLSRKLLTTLKASGNYVAAAEEKPNIDKEVPYVEKGVVKDPKKGDPPAPKSEPKPTPTPAGK